MENLDVRSRSHRTFPPGSWKTQDPILTSIMPETFVSFATVLGGRGRDRTRRGVRDETGRIDELLLLRDGVPPSDLAAVGEVLCVRPRGTLWIYRSEGQTQVLRLRDGTGWAACRDLARQTEEFLALYGSAFTRQCAFTLIQATWLASQQGQGASLILVNQSHGDYQKACTTMAPGVPQRRLALSIPVAFQHPRELLRLATLDGSTLVAVGAGMLEIHDACAYFMTPGGRSVCLLRRSHIEMVRGCVGHLRRRPDFLVQEGSRRDRRRRLDPLDLARRDGFLSLRVEVDRGLCTYQRPVPPGALVAGKGCGPRSGKRSNGMTFCAKKMGLKLIKLAVAAPARTREAGPGAPPRQGPKGPIRRLKVDPAVTIGSKDMARLEINALRL